MPKRSKHGHLPFCGTNLRSLIANRVAAETKFTRDMAKANHPPSTFCLVNRNNSHVQNVRVAKSKYRASMQHAGTSKWVVCCLLKMEWPDSVIRARTRGDTGGRQPHGQSSVLIFFNLSESGEEAWWLAGTRQGHEKNAGATESDCCPRHVVIAMRKV
jgi:hypothetical protein